MDHREKKEKQAAQVRTPNIVSVLKDADKGLVAAIVEALDLIPKYRYAMDNKFQFTSLCSSLTVTLIVLIRR